MDTSNIDFNTVCKWFLKAQYNAKSMGHRDSELLWKDGLMWLKKLRKERDEALKKHCSVK